MNTDTAPKKYFNNWSDREGVARSFFPKGAPSDFPKDEQILIAWYGYGDYCGSARVLFERDGEIYEVGAGHCSCYGLQDDQWRPGRVTWASLAMRPRGDGLGAGGCDLDPEAVAAFWRLVDAHVAPKVTP